MRRKFGLNHMNPHSHTNDSCSLPQLHGRNAATSMCTKFCRTSINKQRCPVKLHQMDAEGRRMITGNSAGIYVMERHGVLTETNA
jgi:hypothetical protein